MTELIIVLEVGSGLNSFHSNISDFASSTIAITKSLEISSVYDTFASFCSLQSIFPYKELGELDETNISAFVY